MFTEHAASAVYHFYTYDGNGNVGDLVKSDGTGKGGKGVRLEHCHIALPTWRARSLIPKTPHPSFPGAWKVTANRGVMA